MKSFGPDHGSPFRFESITLSNRFLILCRCNSNISLKSVFVRLYSSKLREICSFECVSVPLQIGSNSHASQIMFMVYHSPLSLSRIPDFIIRSSLVKIFILFSASISRRIRSRNVTTSMIGSDPSAIVFRFNRSTSSAIHRGIGSDLPIEPIIFMVYHSPLSLSRIPRANSRSRGVLVRPSSSLSSRCRSATHFNVASLSSRCTYSRSVSSGSLLV